MSNVVQFNGETRQDIDPEKVLNAARGKLACALVLGFTEDGHLYMASSDGDLGKILVLMEASRAVLLDESFGG